MMNKTLRKQKAGYALSITFYLIGLAAILGALWKAWPQSSTSQNLVLDVWASLWTEQLNLISGIEFKLAYLVVFGGIMLFSATLVLSLSRQWLLLAGEKALFQCPFCRKKWRASPDKALVHCPHCRQLVHPKLVEK